MSHTGNDNIIIQSAIPGTSLIISCRRRRRRRRPRRDDPGFSVLRLILSSPVDKTPPAPNVEPPLYFAATTHDEPKNVNARRTCENTLAQNGAAGSGRIKREAGRDEKLAAVDAWEIDDALCLRENLTGERCNYLLLFSLEESSRRNSSAVRGGGGGFSARGVR